MANLDNNNDSKKSTSVADDIEKSVKRGVENVQEAAKQAAELATDAVTHPIQTAQEFTKQAAKDVVSVKWWARLLQVAFWLALFLVASFFIIISLPATKNWAAQKVISKLNEDLKSQIAFRRVDVDYFGDITIYDVSVKDYRNFDFIKADQVYADSDWFSIISNSRNLQFQSLAINKMDLKVITYKGDSISNFVRFVNLFSNGKPTNKEPFQLRSRVLIRDSRASIINENSAEKGKWLSATGLSLTVPELRVKGSDVFAQINNLRFTTERWGKKHFVETFSTDLTLNKQFLMLKDLTFNTDHTLLQGDVKFNLNNGSWQDFTNKVRWELALQPGSQLSGYDISYFVTNWDNYEPINISGNMSGVLNNMRFTNFLIHNPKVNIFSPALAARNLLNGNFEIETRSLSTDFTYVDIKAMLPGFISAKMKNFADDFGRIKYNGMAKVDPKTVTIPKGSLITGIGNAQVNNFVLSDFSTPVPKYRGHVTVQNLNTAAITKNKSVGLISGNFDLQGQSFDVNQMVITTRSSIDRIEIRDKILRNVSLYGKLDHKKYNGLIAVNDAPARANIKGLIDFSTKKLFADVEAQIQHLDLNYFTGKAEPMTVSGNLQGKVSMTDLNDLNLDVAAENLHFANAKRNFSIPDSSLKAFFENGQRVISVNSPGTVEGKISGRYNLGDLAGMIQNGINKVLVNPPARKLYRGQNFEMNFSVSQALVDMFFPSLFIPAGLKVDGSFEGNSNNLVLNATAEQLAYTMTTAAEISAADRALAQANPQYRITAPENVVSTARADQFLVRINTANSKEQIVVSLDRLEYKDNIFRNLSLTGRNENNQVLHVATKFLLGSPEDEVNDRMKQYAINLNQSYNSNGDYVLRFEPTSVKLNNVEWNIDTSAELNHSITYEKKSKRFVIKNLRIYSDDSELLVTDGRFRSASDFDATGSLKNFQLAKVFDMQAGGNPMDIQGVANGNFSILMNERNLEPLVGLSIDHIKMKGEEMGKIVLNATKSGTPNVFDVDATVESPNLIGANNLHLTGTVNNNTKSPVVNLKAELRDFDLSFAQQFVQQVFGNLRGKATGDLVISGPLNDIDYSGDIALRDLGLKLNFTGVDYSFDDTTIQLSRGLAILNNIAVRDGRTNSSGSISGAIQFQTLSSMGVNLVMRADNLLLLNTTQKNFDLFWGRIYGRGEIYVDGPVSALNISTPNMTTLNNSVFTFNSSSTSNVEEFKMLRFLKEDETGKISVEEKKKTGANMNLNFAVTVDKGTTVNVLVGDGVGDITVRGNAPRLSFQMTRQGVISLDGAYTVENGTFVSREILSRTFQIEKGSSITWDGDALSPTLDITANYVRTVSNVGDYLGMSNLNVPINVLLQTKITRTLTNPFVEPSVKALDVSSQIKEMLDAKMAQQDETLIQFGSILLINSFNVSNSGGFNLNVSNLAESSGYNLFFKQLGSVLNSISNELQIDLNYVQGDEASNTGDRANAGVSYAFSPRVTVKTGLGIPLSKGTASTSQNYLSGEGSVEVDLSKRNDGSFIIRGYSKPTNIGTVAGVAGGAANQTYGAGVVWSRSFDHLFGSKKKRNKAVTKSTKTDSTGVLKISDSVRNNR